MDSNISTRRHVFISGRVQGVCFRARAKETAEALGLTGWVRNRPNGQVECVFEGHSVSVEAMLSWCRQGPPQAKVIEVVVSKESSSGTFTDFQILY